MEVILREHVESLGKRGDVVRVADGYARNYLIPNKLAYKFSDGVRRQVTSEARAKEIRDAREAELAELMRQKIEELQVIRFERKAGENGHLFGSVTNADIADALVEQGIEVEKRHVRLDEPIKRIGTHHVVVHVYHEVNAELAVEVEPEGGVPAAEPPAEEA